MINKSDAIVAFAVIACSLVLLGALVFSIAGNPFSKPHLQFSVDFEDLTGIKQNSAVLYAGNEVGVVDSIEHLSASNRISEDGIIRAHLSILKTIAIPANIDVIIGSESMLGAKHIALKRKDEDSDLLADGAQLTADGAANMLDSMVPGAGAIVANLEAITGDIREFTDGIGQGAARKDLGATFENMKVLTEGLKVLFSGSGDDEGLSKKLTSLAEGLQETTSGLNSLINGPEGAPEEGLKTRAGVILENLESFSTELNATLAGTPDGEPGLRTRLDTITGEVEAILAGNGTDETGLRVKLDSVMSDVQTLILEIQALVVWGEYITGTLAEKPSRLVWGSKENDVPTKEEIIEHLRSTGRPYPVEIRELNETGDSSPTPSKPQAMRAIQASPESQEPPEKKKKSGFFNFRKRRG